MRDRPKDLNGHIIVSYGKTGENVKSAQHIRSNCLVEGSDLTDPSDACGIS